MTDIDEIASGLTKAQRSCVLSEAHKVFGARYWDGPAAALHALRRKGLTSGPFADQPTPLGRAVRAHIMQEPTA